MKRITIIIGFIFGFLVCEAQTKCDYPTRIKEYYIDVTPDFDGAIMKDFFDGRKVILTGESCEGPFHLKVLDADGNVTEERNYERGELFEDKQMVEMPEPPHELKVVVDTAYRAIPF